MGPVPEWRPKTRAAHPSRQILQRKAHKTVRRQKQPHGRIVFGRIDIDLRADFAERFLAFAYGLVKARRLLRIGTVELIENDRTRAQRRKVFAQRRTGSETFYPPTAITNIMPISYE